MMPGSTGFRLSSMKSVLLLLILLLTAVPAAAQIPDSLRRPGADSAKVVADSAKAPPVIVKHTTGTIASLATSVWVWERADLLSEAAVTLTELLQTLPGIAPFRVGLFLQPEVVSTLGQTRGRVQIWLDGYELDPLTEASQDLSRIELANLERVRVERRLDLTRIELSTLEPTDAQPNSRIEAGVGEPDVNVFRGIFLAPRLLVGPFGFTIDRIDTDGLRGQENADVFSGWIKWAYIRGGAAIQAEFRQNSFTRNPESPFPGESKRRDVIVRARAPLLTGLVAELFAGKSTFENDTSVGNPPVADSILVQTPTADVLQYGGRASFDSRVFWGELSARMRDNDVLPSLQVDGQAGVRWPIAGATVAWSHANWKNGGASASMDLRAHAGPFAGVTAFAELSSGKRAGPGARFLDTTDVFLGERKATRFGAALERWGIQASGALVHLDVDSVQSFGLAFDSTDLTFPGGAANGWEFAGSVPLYFKPLSLHGHYTIWPDGAFALYLPNQLWRAALQFHALPLKSGNLELLGRIELRHRGEFFAPAVTDSLGNWETTVIPANRQVDGYLQIRVMDVRLFIRGENLRNNQVIELPGRLVGTPRFLYGIKWEFRN
jgi:hypothetical protein